MSYAIIEFRVKPEGTSYCIRLPSELPEVYQIERYLGQSLQNQQLFLRGVNKDKKRVIVSIEEDCKTKINSNKETLEHRIKQAVDNVEDDIKKEYALRGIYPTEQTCDEVFTHIICNE
ncbi:MAG: hypothetical protein PHH54_04605 [Candidatus Nanoarchaeia archaeon]|nr:hypothetical protein [Candidatus Nanoarchaeia archaeon]MDD5741237.1 hypothetical protein [Candidatus Nanoarchaeia archaeon]